MLKKFLLLSLILYLFLQIELLKSQNQQDIVVSKFISIVDSTYKGDFLLKNGKFYVYDTPRAQGYPFFLSDNWFEGDLVLQNKQYKKVSIKYNIYKNKIICIIDGPSSEKIPIVLNNNIINGFRIENHNFIHSKFIENLPQYGFYEIIYQGSSIQSYASWKKAFLRIYTKEFLGEFDQAQRNLMIVINNEVFPINSKKDFIGIFGENKKQVKSYIKKSHIKILKSDNESLVKLIKFCEEILNKSNQTPL